MRGKNKNRMLAFTGKALWMMTLSLLVLPSATPPGPAAAAMAPETCTDFTLLPAVVAEGPAGNGLAVTLSADGGTAYLALGNAGLQIVDLGDPLAPQQLSLTACAAPAYDVAVAGDLAVAAVRTAGVQIFDCADPAAPASLSTLALDNECFSVALAGDLVFAYDLYALQIIDISIPTAPTLLGSLPLSFGTGRLQVVGDLVYVASSTDGLTIVDVSVPAAPTLVSTLPATAPAVDVQVTGNNAFVSSAGNGLFVVDVSDPATPWVAGQLDRIDIGNSAHELVEHFDFVFLATDWGLQVIDVLDRANPALVNKVGGLEIQSVAFHEDRIFAGLSHQSLRVIDVQHPDHSSRTTVYTTPGFTANDMLVRDGVGYICFGGSGVQVVDLADPDNPAPLATLVTPNSAVEIAFYGPDMAVVTDLSDALHVVDISSPAQPAILGSLSLPDIPRGLAVSETAQQAYVSMNWGGVKIVDISNPTAPVELHEMWDMWMPDRIVADYPLIYVTDGDNGFQVLDVSNPYDPVRLGTVEGYGPGLAVDFPAQVAYMAGEGLVAVDISDPTDMQILADVPVPGYAVEDIVLVGDMAYVAGSIAGMHALDISDRRAPRLIATAMTGDEARSVAAGAGRIYVAAHFGQLEIHLPHCDDVSAVDQGSPALPVEMTAYPNPFNPRTTVRFALEQDCTTDLGVFDLRGRRVATLLNGRQSAGPHAVVWDGKDHQGRGVASGVYLAVLRAGGRLHTTRLALLR